MTNPVEVKVPDIGDFKNVPVVEVLVKPGDTVQPEDPLVTLESDKATLEVPSPAAGVVKELKLKIGDKVSQGSLILTLDAAAAPASAKPAAAPTQPVGADQPRPAPTSAAEPSATFASSTDVECDMRVLGAGLG